MDKKEIKTFRQNQIVFNILLGTLIGLIFIFIGILSSSIQDLKDKDTSLIHRLNEFSDTFELECVEYSDSTTYTYEFNSESNMIFEVNISNYFENITLCRNGKCANVIISKKCTKYNVVKNNAP